MSKQVKQEVHPLLHAYHNDFHSKSLDLKKAWQALIEENQHYITPATQKLVHSYNELMQKQVDSHNERGQTLAIQNNLEYKSLKNKYAMEIPEVGMHIQTLLCTCKDCDVSNETTTGTEVSQCEPEQEHAEIEKGMAAVSITDDKIETSVAATKAIEIDESMIPEEYKN